MRKPVAALFLVLGALHTARADRVVLIDGRELAGDVHAETADSVAIDVQGVRTRVKRSDLREVVREQRNDMASPLPWDHALEMKTEHYVVQSNSDAKFAAEVGRRMELLYDAVFDFFRGSPVKLHKATRLRVAVFHQQADFKACMKERYPERIESQGFFDEKTKTTYLFRAFENGTEATWATLQHEGTHQLLFQAGNQGRVQDKAQYWLVEAIPCLMEGLVEKGGKLVPGVPAGRLAGAKRLLDADAFEPVTTFVKRTQAGFQTAALYDQGWALADLLVNGEGGKFRVKFLALADTVLDARGTADSLGKALGREAAGIDEALRKHVSGMGSEPR